MSGPASAATLLEGIDLVVFDKDGTLIHFKLMWRDWAHALAARLERELGRPFEAEALGILGIDPATGTILPHGMLAATPMKLIREALLGRMLDAGIEPARAAAALDEVWRPPDPVASVVPVTDLVELLGALRATGRRIAVVTADDRVPTERTLAALGIAALVDAVACADEGRPTKPAPDGVLHVCAVTGVPPERTLVVGDSPADLWMGRNARAGRVVGVLTGVSEASLLASLADAVLDSIAGLHPGSAAAAEA